MPTVWIPATLRTLTHHQETVRVGGATVREVIDGLDVQFPGIKARLCNGDNLRPGIVVAIDSDVSRAGLGQEVNENSEVHFLPAIGGG
jgi:molybdopterin synthase sulfur carrier subunit